MANHFGRLDVDLGELSSSILAFRALVLDDKEFARFKKLGHGKAFRSAEVLANEGKGTNLVFVAYKRGDDAVEQVLKEAGGDELNLKAKYLDSTRTKYLKSVARLKAENAKRDAEIKKELGTLSDRHYSRLSAIRESLRIEISRAEVGSSLQKDGQHVRG